MALKNSKNKKGDDAGQRRVFDKGKSPGGAAPGKKGVAGKKKPIEKMVQSNSSTELVIEKRKANEKVVKWLKIDAVISVVVCVTLLFLAIGVVTSKNTEVFLATDSEGRFKELTPLYQPKHSNAFVGDWLNKCLVKTFDFSYANYDRRLGEVINECYSEDGAKSLQNALINSGNLEAVKSKRLYISLTLHYIPTVVRQMKPSSTSQPYRWALQSRGVITLSSQTSNDPNQVSVTAVVSRASYENTASGLVIDRLIIN